MLEPQWMAVKTAYEPWIQMQRHILIDANKNGYATADSDIFRPENLCFSFDHTHYEIFVYARGFKTIEAARAALMWCITHTSTLIKCGGVTDLVTALEYANNQGLNGGRK
jgi:hypothetical protein